MCYSESSIKQNATGRHIVHSRFAVGLVLLPLQSYAQCFVYHCLSMFYWPWEPHRWCNGQCATLSAVDRGFEPQSDHTKDYKIGICCFSAKHAALRRKSKNWLTRNQNNVFEWDDMSVSQHYENPTKRVGLVQSGPHHHHHHLKIAELALIDNHSLIICHCIVCSSSNYGFWLTLWYLQTFLAKICL